MSDTQNKFMVAAKLCGIDIHQLWKVWPDRGWFIRSPELTVADNEFGFLASFQHLEDGAWLVTRLEICNNGAAIILQLDNCSRSVQAPCPQPLSAYFTTAGFEIVGPIIVAETLALSPEKFPFIDGAFKALIEERPELADHYCKVATAYEAAKEFGVIQ